MTARGWIRAASVSGFVLLLVGGIDPLEGSLLIFPGSGLLALAAHFSEGGLGGARLRLWLFLSIVFGVAALWILSVLGGMGGDSGRSMWWALLVLPYMLGWSFSVWAPGSPRWALVGGVLVSLWYLILGYMVLTRAAEPDSAMLLAPIALSVLGLITLAGCAWRLQRP